MPPADFFREKLGVSISSPTPGGLDLDGHEMSLSDMIPYTVHYDDHTVITKDNGLVQVIKLDGLLFESLSMAQIRQFEKRRNTTLRAIADSHIGVYVHLVRRKHQVYPEGEGQAWFAKLFNSAWRRHYENKNFYINDIYISLVCNPVRMGAPGWIDRIANFITQKKVTPEDLNTFQYQEKKIVEASRTVLESFSDYAARLLCIQRLPDLSRHQWISSREAQQHVARFKLHWNDFEAQSGQRETYPSRELIDFLGAEFSELAEFFHYLINLEQSRIPLSALPLNLSLAVSRINANFTSNLMEIQSLSGSHAAAVVSMAEWPSRTSSRMMDAFLKLPLELIITQSFFFTDRIQAEADLKLEKRRIAVNDQAGMAEEDTNDLKQGLQELSRGRSVNGYHHLTMLVHVRTEAHAAAQANADSRNRALAELDAAVGLLKNAFIGLGVKAVREHFGMESFFWSQLPGQPTHFIGRRGKINSANFAGFASLHNFATGKIAGNLWGAAIMPFETESGTAYHFNFHREMDGMVAGHTAITADTGAGKTTLLSALIAMADKTNPRVFWFDNRHGAKVFMAAMGGLHTTLSVSGCSGWNPFHLPDTPENRAYLVELLTLMRSCYGGVVQPDDIRRFKKAVEENYHFPDMADRRLRNISWCFGVGSDLDRDMAIWHGANGQPGANWGVFDNEHDQFDLHSCRHYCFEMQQLLKDGAARPELPVILSYPFHRIEQAMNGSPFILVLEEGQNLVRHAYWREKIDAYIMQIRRKNGVLIFVTPDAKYLYCETDAIQKQTVTKIYLPNDKYSRAEFVDVLSNTEAEFQFLIDNVKSRKFLIKRGNESVKALFDLSGMPEFIPVLSSNDKGVALMEQVMTEVGSRAPEQWVPVFMQRALSENTHNLLRKEVR